MRLAIVAFLACGSLAVTGLACASAAGTSVDRLLDGNRAAVGSMAAGSETLHYRYAGQGLAGTVELVFDPGNGRYVERLDMPPVREANGFDGATPWQTDLSGASTPQQGGDRPALAVNRAYRLAQRWWSPDRGGARIQSVGRDAEGDHLRVVPVGGKPFDAWFDPVSHLLVHVREGRGFQTIDERYGDYARQSGAMLPRTTVIEDGSGRAGAQTLTLQDATSAVAQSAAFFAMPVARPDDWGIAGASLVTLPMRLLNNHVVVDVRVNGKGPFPFLLDTGGHSILTPSTATALGLTRTGAAVASGAGTQTQISGYTRVQSLSLGAASMQDQTVLILDFSPRAVEGYTLGGMVGSELLQRFVARIDYGANTLTLIDPAHFDPRDAGIAVPFRFYDHMPFVEGQFAGIPARFNIDTGSRSGVSMTLPFVQARRLRQRFPHGILAVDGWGVGGPGRSEVVRAPSLEIGGIAVPDIVASLTTQPRGSFSDANYDGNIGSGFLKRFVVTFDYGHRIMYLKPRVQPSDDIGTFDRAGMWINLGEEGYDVMDVAAGGAANKAGLAVGDVILSLDGKSPRTLSLADARRMLRSSPAGTTVAVEVRRAGRTRSLPLVLRDQIPAHGVILPD